MKTSAHMMIVALLLWCGASAGGQAARAPTSNGSSTTVLVVSGISRDPSDQTARKQAVSTLREHLLKEMNVEPRRVVVLAGDGQEGATAARIGETIRTLAQAIRPEDRFIFYYLGQANAVNGELRFNLPGPDMTHSELAERLKAIKAGTQLVVLDCPCAGLAAKALTADHRIIVCASMAAQVFATRFTTHFVQALAAPETDADNNGKITLLEAFTAAARQVEQWYREKAVLATETPCLEDDGDGTPSERPWKHEAEGGDGAKAAASILAERH
ncbi:MAG: hypothetical protein A2Y77_13420 [Planctomycetes bacterium RBG_13_62_9]|nr:MAG: hypothetical protein A2Y77_13420 [Planctomycetes bacterium RBG_13_62_9]